jgi:hypothetical protein
MQFRPWKPQLQKAPSARYLKCGAPLLLLLFSMLIVACGAGTEANSTLTTPDGPVVTVTIRLDTNKRGSPTPTLPNVWCGAWATQSMPNYDDGKTTVAVNAKFTQNVNGNPIGVDAATATATLFWADGTSQSQTANTTPDGLAVFFFPTEGRSGALNKISIATVHFSKPGIGECTVGQDRAAFFTLVDIKPTKTPTPHNNDKNGDNNTKNNDNTN